MNDQDFDIDHVLRNIKAKLRDREESVGEQDRVIELTEVVNIETESHISSSITPDNHYELYEGINNASINNELKNFDASSIKQTITEAAEKSIYGGLDQEKIEFLIRRELRKTFKVWAEKNLKYLVHDLVHKEIIKMMREAD